MRTGVSFQREQWATFAPEAQPLFERHWREVAKYLDIALLVDHQRYISVDQAGRLRVYTMRLAGALIGYAVYFLDHHLHYRQALMATQDILYLAPEHRRGFNGIKLLRYSDDMLRDEGVQIVTQHVKLDHPALATIARRAGYEPIEVIWGKRLDRPRGTGTRQGEAGRGGEEANKARAAAIVQEQRETIEWDSLRR